jgi:hypothetical protein
MGHAALLLADHFKIRTSPIDHQQTQEYLSQHSAHDIRTARFGSAFLARLPAPRRGFLPRPLPLLLPLPSLPTPFSSHSACLDDGLLAFLFTSFIFSLLSCSLSFAFSAFSWLTVFSNSMYFSLKSV